MDLLSFLLLWAVFLQILLPLAILLKMRKVRVQAFNDGHVTIEKIAADHTAWPENVRQVQNSYISQFELPMLFYVACVLVLTSVVPMNWFFVVISALFVLSRWAHMIIHTGSNRIQHRFKAFLVGMICIVLQWGYIIGFGTLMYMQNL